jgi:hypothetical protein
MDNDATATWLVFLTTLALLGAFLFCYLEKADLTDPNLVPTTTIW